MWYKWLSSVIQHDDPPISKGFLIANVTFLYWKITGMTRISEISEKFTIKTMSRDRWTVRLWDERILELDTKHKNQVRVDLVRCLLPKHQLVYQIFWSWIYYYLTGAGNSVGPSRVILCIHWLFTSSRDRHRKVCGYTVDFSESMVPNKAWVFVVLHMWAYSPSVSLDCLIDPREI